jgi:hypothetical protein
MPLPDAIDALIDRQAESRKTYDALNMAYITRNPSMSTLSRTVNAINYVNGTDDIVDADAIVRDMYANARDERKRNTYSGTRAIADTIADYSPTTPDIADAVISALDGAVDIDKWAQLDNMWATYTSKLYRKGLAKLADYGRADYDSIPTGIRQAHDSLVFKFNKTFGVSLSRFEFHTLCKHFYNADNADKGGK